MRGKVSDALPVAFPLPDHPRLCGEKHVFPEVAVLVPGSPPPMRGKEAAELFGKLANRITPAYAGKRRMKPLASYGTRDHPRLCGEKCPLHCTL